MAAVKTHAKFKKRSQLKCIKTKQWQQLWNDTSSEMAHVGTLFYDYWKELRQFPEKGEKCQIKDKSRTEFIPEQISQIKNYPQKFRTEG